MRSSNPSLVEIIHRLTIIKVAVVEVEVALEVLVLGAFRFEPAYKRRDGRMRVSDTAVDESKQRRGILAASDTLSMLPWDDDHWFGGEHHFIL
jgi:hypothetical protein